LRSFYGVQEPLRLKGHLNKLVDEYKLYAGYRGETKSEKKMKILLVGELAYNAERIVALEKNGCELYGLWIPKPQYSFNTVGHIYTDSYHETEETYNKHMTLVAPNHFHLHPFCTSENWVEEYSRYDAGWLHYFKSANEGDIIIDEHVPGLIDFFNQVIEKTKKR